MHIHKVHIVKNKMLTSCEMLTKPIIVVNQDALFNKEGFKPTTSTNEVENLPSVLVVIVGGSNNKKNTFIFVGQNPKYDVRCTNKNEVVYTYIIHLDIFQILIPTNINE